MWETSNNASTMKHESTQGLQVPNKDLKQELQGPN